MKKKELAPYPEILNLDLTRTPEVISPLSVLGDTLR